MINTPARFTIRAYCFVALISTGVVGALGVVLPATAGAYATIEAAADLLHGARVSPMAVSTNRSRRPTRTATKPVRDDQPSVAAEQRYGIGGAGWELGAVRRDRRDG